MCGVFGIRAPERDVARVTFFGLFALQHRGQESAGIAVSDAGRLTVLRDMGLVAHRLGVPAPPTTVAELRAALAAFRPELLATADARDAARFLMFPPMPAYARAPYGVLAAASVALLPWWARWQLRLPVLPVTEEIVVKPAGAAVTGVLRWAMTGRG